MPSEGDRANAGTCDRFPIFDIYDPANPVLVSVPVLWPQNDPDGGVPVTTSEGSKSIVNACFMGGANDVGFTDPVNPTEVACYDIAPFGPAGSDHRCEGAGLGGDSVTRCASDGVHDLPPVQTNGRGFGVCPVGGWSDDINLDPQFPDPGVRSSAGDRRVCCGEAGRGCPADHAGRRGSVAVYRL